MITDLMLIELNYVFFSVILVIFCAWRFYKRRGNGWLFSTLAFTFLTLSILFQLFSSSWSTYTSLFTINYRTLRIAGLALFMGFVISTIIALRGMPTKTSKP